MIEYFATALLLVQPAAALAPAPATAAATAPAAAAPAAPAAPAAKPQKLRNPVDIRAELFELLGNKNQASYKGNVRVRHRTLDLRCDELTAHYSRGNAQQVQRVECVGNVVAVDGDRTAKGERADFDVASGTLVVTGSPEARQGPNYMRGTKVTLTVGNRRIRVENAETIFETSPEGLPQLPGGAPRTGGGQP
ncbi:MAG TPA: LptA/OstA family protein [Aggregicoccus sp.]|nr:LptA/OstA family protein [Aggregicoccus sp.]